MLRTKRFTFVVNNEERALIASLANLLQRSQSDAVRLIVLKAALELMSGVDTLVQPADQSTQGAIHDAG